MVLFVAFGGFPGSGNLFVIFPGGGVILGASTAPFIMLLIMSGVN